MNSDKIVRGLAVVAISSLVLGAFAAVPAEAKKKKKKKPPACAAYAPGELGADAQITKVTDAATEEKPVEVTVSTGPGLGFSSPDVGGDTGETSHAYANLQVDSASRSANLYVRVEFTPSWDYDIFLRTSDGTALAYAAGFNQGMGAGLGDPTGAGLDGTGNGGHSEMGAEAIDGYAAADCDGFTLDISSAGTPGEDVTVKYWLGEPAA